MDKGLSTVGVFIDLKKAFDTINHSILIKKLYKYGIRGNALKWIENYLSNRKLYVVCNGAMSSSNTVLCGIPQGSVLGPLLFLLHINDLANISKKLKFILFADDTSVFCSGENMNVVIQMLHDELRNMSVWFKVNKLSLNVSKANYMVFSNKWKHSYNTNEIKIDDILIEEVTVTKFLGVLIDNKLQWKEQIDSVCSKVSKNLSIIYRVRHILDANSLLPRPPEGVARYCFHPVCLSVCVSVCVCVCVSGQYFGILFFGY